MLVNEGLHNYSLSPVLQSPVQSGKGKLFDPLHFPDLTEHGTLRTSSLHLAAVEQFGKLLFTGQQVTKICEKIILKGRAGRVKGGTENCDGVPE